MPLRNPLSPSRSRRTALSLAIAIVGFAAALLVGMAVAKTFTLKVEKNAKVTNANTNVTKRETIATFHGFAVYTLSGDSKHHPQCVKSNMCLTFWPPVTVASAKKLSKAPGISGKLGTWHRNGFTQVTLNGHPLYMFSQDKGNGAATGEGIQNFGGVWHVLKASAAKASGPGGSGSTTGTGTSGSGTSSSTTTGSTSSSTSSSTTSHWG
jgi:predicted lipoprotein with Yx(FWY)xxD motif